ncbi:MAG: type 1 glutamine amidotransferase [Gammaproteobacteria bacterium]
MQPVFIIRHADGAGPGYLAEFLALRRVPLELFRLDQDETMPATLSHASGLVVMGGPRPREGRHGASAAAASSPTFERECDLVVEACDRGLPVIGHGFGAEIVCLALGGSVATDPNREIGWFPVRAAGGTIAKRWWQGLPSNTEVFHWRDTTLSLPAGADALIQSDQIQSDQGFVMDKALALQCHLQVTPKMVTEWVTRYHDALHGPADGPSGRVQTQTEITRSLPQRVRALRRITDPVYTRWLEGFGERPESQ